MHEFSLAVEVISLAEREAERHGAGTIREISIEVGDLSGVEADAFESALELLVKESILENSVIEIVRIPGKGFCSECDQEFEMKFRMAACPVCRCFPSKISGGEEFRVVSLLVD